MVFKVGHKVNLGRTGELNGRWKGGVSRTKACCITCSEVFYFYPYKNHKGIFCSSQCWGKHLKGKPSGKKPMLGKKHSSLTKSKMKLSHAGKLTTLQKRIKCSISKLGSKNPSWKGGTTPLLRTARHSLNYKLWREAVFERDNYTCQCCKERGGYLQAHHIKSFAKHPELRFDVSNGQTLCLPCHKLTDNYSWKAR